MYFQPVLAVGNFFGPLHAIADWFWERLQSLAVWMGEEGQLVVNWLWNQLIGLYGDWQQFAYAKLQGRLTSLEGLFSVDLSALDVPIAKMNYLFPVAELYTDCTLLMTVATGMCALKMVWRFIPFVGGK